MLRVVALSVVGVIASAFVATAAFGGVTPITRAAGVAAVSLKFASVKSDGTLVASQSSGAESATRASQGQFRITFDGSIERCAVASASGAGSTGANTFTFNTKIATKISGSSLYVSLTGQNDGPSDFAFSVILACRGGVVAAGGVTTTTSTTSGSPSLASTLRFATVSSAGALSRTQSYGASSATRASQGQFRVTFDASIAGCAVSAASGAGSTTLNTFTFNTHIATTISGSTLYVSLTGKNDGPADFAFSVILACAS
ncbi:unannotated protein [freshwater metagenome]|uniref:Unannotated protein n=1 Tax=freshwater metagenome TaxID=449393 RepID=A0A6J6PSD2_9ZZZZ